MDVVPIKAVNPAPPYPEAVARPWQRRMLPSAPRSAPSADEEAPRLPAGRSGSPSPQAVPAGTTTLLSTGDSAANLSPNALPKVSLAVSPARAAEAFQPAGLAAMAQQMMDLAEPLEFGGTSSVIVGREILSEADALGQVQVSDRSPALAEEELVLQYDINNAFQAEGTEGTVISNADPELSVALHRLLGAAERVLGVA
jgi:hypothetical protein